MLQQFSAAALVGIVAGNVCPLGYKGAPFRTYSDCVSAMKSYGPLSFLAHTCAPCVWGSQLGAGSATETILEFTIEDNGESGKDLYYARGSSSCWGIPGLAPQMDGSINVVPDESNFACTASGRDYAYYQHLIVPLTYDTKRDLFHNHEVHVAEVEFYGYGYNRSGTVEWEYGCKVLDTDLDPYQSPDFKVSCDERSPTHEYSLKGYTVTVEKASAIVLI